MKYYEYSMVGLYHELLANRYLLTTILTSLYTTIDILNQKDELLRGIITDKELKETIKLNRRMDDIHFELFSIPQRQYQVLVNQYEAPIVADAAVLLDNYLKRTGKHIKKPYRHLNLLCKKLKGKLEMKQDLIEAGNIIRSIDYETIDDIELAKKYIRLTPQYLQNIDKGCIYLKEKFSL